MRYARSITVVLAVTALCAAARGGENVKVLHDFEDSAEVRRWEFKKAKPAFSTEHATLGRHSMKLAPNEYMVNTLSKWDWSGYDALEIDFFVDGDEGVGVSLLVGDEDWTNKGRKYWNRHNGSFNLQPGKNTASIPVEGLYRGEAGSRNNDLAYNIKPDKIIRIDFGFRPMGKSVKAIYMDNMRLVKESRPEGVLAFDFGPPSQVVFPGFTPVSWNTVYGEEGRKYGLKKVCSHPNRARDDTFPSRLYQDFVEMYFDNSMFMVDVPNGEYHVWLVYDDCGYWGGEVCKHQWRYIEAEYKKAWEQKRGEAGPPDYLFRFEGVEPKPGDSLWDLYVGTIFKPARLRTTVRDGQLNLRFRADVAWSSKVAGIIIYPDSKKAEAEKWVAEVEARNRKEFESRAAFIGPKPKRLEVPADASRKGWWLGFPSLSDTVTFYDPPGGPGAGLSNMAARGQRASLTFAVRPLRDHGAEALTLSCGDLKARRGRIPASNVDLRYVHHLVKRGFNNIAYRILPESVRRVEGSGLKLTKGLTRQFWINVTVPDDAPAGKYSGTVRLAAGGLRETIPLEIEVLDVKLDEPDFMIAMFGSWVPRELPAARKKTAQKELFTLLRGFGMNGFTGGPNVPLKGFDAAGKPILDFTAIDEHFRIAEECGLTKEVHGYGGPGHVTGLHGRGVIGPKGREWEKKTGKPFKEVLRTVYAAWRDHAKEKKWPKLALSFIDEPRVLDKAQAQLEFLKAFRDGAPFVRFGGYYSVHWERTDPLSKAIQGIFETMPFSALNSHRQADIDKAKELGRELYIYNQGLSRYSFGAYQWAEMHKGVRGRVQWHLLALHGYQFFDLDGREPDTATVNWGRDEIIPTIKLYRVAEGIVDFKLAVTLWNAAQKKMGTAAGRAAIDFLEKVSRDIAPGGRRRPKGFMSDDEFRGTCIELLRKL